jgi:geranylgeranyl diphosphate synthase type I
LSFQIYDDWLGIWGDPVLTGKSISSDLAERKKSMPVLLGFKKSTDFINVWKSQKTDAKSTKLMADILKRDGIEDALLDELKIHNEAAINALHNTDCCNKIQSAIFELIGLLISRKR